MYDSSGARVAEFQAGGTYTWKATYPNPSVSMVLASVGHIASNMSTHDDQKLCSIPGMRVTFSTGMPYPTEVMGTWAAPDAEDPSQEVYFDIVRAEGSSFFTSRAIVCREGAVECNDSGVSNDEGTRPSFRLLHTEVQQQSHDALAPVVPS
eukprot:jgi/Tetstr1/463185/TSEL_008117.t1